MLLSSIPDAVVNVYIAVLRVRNRLVAAAGLSVFMGIGIVVLSWALLPVLGINAVGWAFLAMQLCGCAFVVLDLLRSARLGGVVRYRADDALVFATNSTGPGGELINVPIGTECAPPQRAWRRHDLSSADDEIVLALPDGTHTEMDADIRSSDCRLKSSPTLLRRKDRA